MEDFREQGPSAGKPHPLGNNASILVGTPTERPLIPNDSLELAGTDKVLSRHHNILTTRAIAFKKEEVL